jgi:hypothetical protein
MIFFRDAGETDGHCLCLASVYLCKKRITRSCSWSHKHTSLPLNSEEACQKPCTLCWHHCHTFCTAQKMLNSAGFHNTALFSLWVYHLSAAGAESLHSFKSHTAAPQGSLGQVTADRLPSSEYFVSPSHLGFLTEARLCHLLGRRTTPECHPLSLREQLFSP